MKPRGTVAAIATALSLMSPATLARADGLDDDRVNARAISRAGAVGVSDDGAAALVATPASLARRTVTRAAVGIAVRDYDPRHQLPDGGPRIANQAPATAAPTLFAATGGDSWVAAGAYTESADRAVRTAEPAFGQPAAQVAALFPHRYAGTRLRHQTRTVTLGAAARVGPWLALGASVSAARVDLQQTQTLWAGFSGLAEVGDPTRDLAISLDAADPFVPGGAVGALAIVGDSGLEVSVGARIVDDARLAGTAVLAPTGPQAFPRVVDSTADADAIAPGSASAQLAARYAGPRFALETSGAYRRFHGDPRSWRTTVSAQDQEMLPPDPVGPVPVQVNATDHWEIAGAAEFEVVPAYLWLVGGYSYRSRSDRRVDSRVTTADGALHTVAAGAEVYWRDVTIVAGYSRGLSTATDVATDRTNVFIVNPFDGGSAAVGAGEFTRAEDRFALSIEIAWDPLASSVGEIAVE